MTTPAERAFAFFQRGDVREDMLATWRLGLSALFNPETGALFTQDEIAQATQQGSRWWIEADAIDLMGMAIQSRSLYMADQVRVDRAAHNFLVGYHGDLWLGEDPLPANPGSGPFAIAATPGTIYPGSLTVPDPAAVTFRDPAGLRYQVLITVTTPGGGTAALTLIGIDTGPQTNLVNGTELTVDLNPPLGGQPKGLATQDFTGGLPEESDADYAKRIRDTVRHKQGAGNNAQMRAWARQASTAIQDAYVYACALHAGSVLVAITQRRGSTVGPNAMVANVATMASATAYLVPPGSTTVPARPFVVVTSFTPVAANTIVELSQPKGNASGWHDVSPWPGYTAAVSSITALVDQQHFSIHSDIVLPGGAGSLTGADAPHLMAWNAATSRFEALVVTSVTSSGGGVFAVVLASAPTTTLAVGSWISPDMARREVLGETAEQYFDGLGPGEVIDIATDTRADRAARFPEPAEEAPYRGGQAIITAISDALGGALADASLVSMSTTTPPLPADVILGPGKLTLGKFAVYDLL
jgi:hypothetical protein